MSDKNLSNREKKSTSNSQLKSSIVHKPFATGTINIFNPHRNKSNAGLSAPKLFLNAELEDKIPPPQEAEPQSDLDYSEVKYRDRNWLDSLLSPWGISAIAIIFFANLVSGAVIWRNSQTAINSSNDDRSTVSTVGNANLATEEFMPLNLSTLSAIKTVGDASVKAQQPAVTPISPALAPLNNVATLSSINHQYYYVLTEYTGDRSLSLARQKVKQVSLVNFPQGVFIYLGAFTDKNQADEFVSWLKQENFPAYLYPFD
ncbi:MAG: hypothetical protein QNJ53_01280 [Pleurocapsa sp. MO_192.B19]|nr:hypothetical protein [Pleurocapsa sp. MO_192.B19]